MSLLPPAHKAIASHTRATLDYKGMRYIECTTYICAANIFSTHPAPATAMMEPASLFTPSWCPVCVSCTRWRAAAPRACPPVRVRASQWRQSV